MNENQKMLAEIEGIREARAMTPAQRMEALVGVPTGSSYNLAHQNVTRSRGKAREHTCPCGAPAQDWAYQGSDSEEVDSKGRRFSMNADDYEAMCRRCHSRLDAKPDDIRYQ